MPTFTFKKLVRDSIIEILEKEGYQNIRYHQLSPDEHLIALKDKLLEEAKEVKESDSKQELESEIGDVLEVLDSLIEKAGLSRERIKKNRQEKSHKTGSFRQGLYVTSCDVPLDNRLLLNMMRAQPNKYPEE